MARREIRFAVGTPTGRRSTVWKFVAQRGDVYIFTRMFGRDVKVSLHKTGDYFWSATGDWVTKDPTRRNQDRHFVTWKTERPSDIPAQHAFRILIPESELRRVSEPEDLDGVRWIPEPPPGETFVFECYISPPSATEPTTEGHPYLHLVSLPLDDERWFVVLLSQVTVDELGLSNLRSEVISQVRSSGLEPNPDHRAAAFIEFGDGPRGLIEIALVEEGDNI